MANEYLVNSADLTSVADAIREKGETTEQLVFPSGFVTAIENMKGGADLNFEIVGGTTQPSNPKENTIWVNTGTAITGWVFSTETPENPVSGMVWFRVSSASPVSFNALKENNITVYPYQCYQYINGAYESKVAVSYINGDWVNWVLYLYNQGNLCEDVTGGWDSIISIDSSWSKEQLSLNATNMSGSYTQYLYDIYRCTSNAIDLSEKTLYMRYSISTTKKTYACLRLYSRLSASALVAESVVDIAAGESVERAVTFIDCSSITTPVYIVVDSVSATSGASATFTVHEVWAEEA